LAEATTTLKLTHGAMSPDQAEIVKRANTVGYIPLHHLAAVTADYRSHPDSLTFGEITAIGPGRPELSQDRPRVQVGDLVSYKRNRIARELDDPDDPDIDNPDTPAKKLFMLHEGGLVFRHPEGPGGMPEPLMDYILTEVDPDGAQKALGRAMPLTPEEVEWGISTRVHEQPGAHQCPACKQKLSRNAGPGSVVDSKDRVMVERLVSTGPGRWLKAIWPPVFGARTEDVWVDNFHGDPPIGKMVMFSSANERARFRLHGRVFTIASWQDYIAAFDGVAGG
jgi:hypothetical protein